MKRTDPEKIKVFRESFKNLMEERGLKTEEVAVKLKLSNSTIQSWLRSVRTPSWATMKFIEREYKVKLL